MRNILVTVSQAEDGTYWCHTEEDVYDSGLNGAGNTVSEAKHDLMVCLEESRRDVLAHGGEVEPVEFRYQYDLQSFFEYFSFLNVTEIARRSGINPSLMRQYVSGLKNAGEKTYSRLSSCIENISRELNAATFR